MPCELAGPYLLPLPRSAAKIRWLTLSQGFRGKPDTNEFFRNLLSASSAFWTYLLLSASDLRLEK